MAISYSSYDSLIADISAGKTKTWEFYKAGSAAQVAGAMHSLWFAAGSPAAGAAAAVSPGESLTSAAGGMVFADAAPDIKHLIGLAAQSTSAGTFIIYDRLYQVGGISLTSTGDKALNNGSIVLPRYTDGIGVLPLIEVTTATTTTAPVVTLTSYVNQADAIKTTAASLTFPAAATVLNLCSWLPIVAGDTGVKQVTTLNVGTAASAGVACVSLVKPLVYMPVIANIGNAMDLVLQVLAMPRLYDGATLGIMYVAGTTTALNVHGQIRLVY
jgi:hypothetical protein